MGIDPLAGEGYPAVIRVMKLELILRIEGVEIQSSLPRDGLVILVIVVPAGQLLQGAAVKAVVGGIAGALPPAMCGGIGTQDVEGAVLRRPGGPEPVVA